MKLRLIAAGKIKERSLRDAAAEYVKRLSSFCTLEIAEVPDEKTPEHAPEAIERKIKEIEGKRLLAKVPGKSFLIVLAIEGRELSSEELAGKLSELMLRGQSDISILIGGSLGLSEEVLQRADFLLSFSRMTFPHQLMRLIALEQLYRSFKINAGEPYHK